MTAPIATLLGASIGALVAIAALVANVVNTRATLRQQRDLAESERAHARSLAQDERVWVKKSAVYEQISAWSVANDRRAVWVGPIQQGLKPQCIAPSDQLLASAWLFADEAIAVVLQDLFAHAECELAAIDKINEAPVGTPWLSSLGRQGDDVGTPAEALRDARRSWLRSSTQLRDALRQAYGIATERAARE